MISYTVTAQDPFGHGLVNVPRIEELRAAMAVNSVGTATLVLPDKYLPSYWRRDMRFKFYRKAYGGARYLLGNTVWFARRFKQSWTGKFWEISLKDCNTILERPLIAYKQETTYAEKTAINGNDDTAEVLMKSFVRENMGGLVVDQNRNLGFHFRVEDNKNIGPIVEKTASYTELFSTLTGLANDSAERGTKLYFDVAPGPNTVTTQFPEEFTFRVWRDYPGTDRSGVVNFTPQNLTGIELEWNYEDEVTVVYAGGMGQGATRLVVEEKDDSRIRQSPFGRRETFIEVDNVDVESVLRDEAKAKLYKYTPKVVLMARVVDTPQLQFGRDYFYGDLVQSTVGSLSFTPLIDAFSVSFAGQKEDLDVRLRAETS